MEFENRLEALYDSSSAPVHETDAAVNIYERLVTARAMCVSLFGPEVSAGAVATVMAELSTESRFLLLNDERLQAEGAIDPD
jgi:hypothetical protein